jgi:7-cyano-7-deazaguanine synthase in queuosine biosynthesis
MKALVLFSGGVDSTTCLGLAVDKYGADQVLALSVSYGQKHQKEVEAAGKIAAHYGVKWQQLDLSVIFADSNCSLLSGSTQGDLRRTAPGDKRQPGFHLCAVPEWSVSVQCGKHCLV